MTPAAIYCRSSKDKAEIGLETQRKELRAYAQAHGLKVVEEYSDMEISGSLDEVSRPDLRKLLLEMAAPGRKWNVLLAVDTSRISRDPMLALYVQRECEKHGVEMLYSKVGISGKDAIGEMLLANLRAFDRLHSRLSAEKGRAGLETNISKGFRAGGSAPYGYKLDSVKTGAVRGGVEVAKSRLVPDPRKAKKVQAFLRLRARGTPRHIAAKETRITDKTQGSLIAIERNALTYAGYMVWNQRKKHRPTREDPRRTMLWRPREEWVVSPKPTHEALITRAEADKVLALVDKDNPRPRGLDIRKPDSYLLTGLLFAPDGTPWQADGRFYRMGRKGQRVLREAVDELVLHQIAREVRGKAFVGQVVQGAHEMAAEIEDNPATIEQALRSVEAKISRITDALEDAKDSKALLAKLTVLEADRDRLQDERATVVERAKLKGALSSLNTKQVEAMLEFAPTSPEADVAYVRRSLGALVSRVEFDATARAVRVHYRVEVPTAKGGGGAKLASPRGFEPRLPP